MRLLPKRRRKLTAEQCTDRWQALQKHCASRKTWPQAIIEADKLLEDALRATRYKGKTTGERLVAAQRVLTNNEGIWLGHKLRNRIIQDGIDVRTLKKKDMLEALNGFRQALRDLGVMR